jgi:predicted glycogen debranching enzyme
MTLMSSSSRTFGRQLCGHLDAAVSREWLVTDGLGGFAMGTVAGLRTRRYHGLLVAATTPPIGRHLGLAALDVVLVVGEHRIELATHEWSDGTIAPNGHRDLSEFALIDGVPRWRWSIGPVVVQAEIAMVYGQPATGVSYRLLRRGEDDVRLELSALCTWRDVHGERFEGSDPYVEHSDEGFVFEGAYRVRGPGFEPSGSWYRGVHHREEAARGLNSNEDLWCAGRFVTDLEVGGVVDVEAWAGNLADSPPPASEIVTRARRRFTEVGALAQAGDPAEELLAHAADQFIVMGNTGPTVVAGYPWFGDWSRDTMTSYEGLFLDTGRHVEGRALLVAAAAAVSEGMLANTADAGGTEYNTVDGTLWFLHAVGRHIERTGDLLLGEEMKSTVQSIIEHHVAGTRFGIRIDADGLLAQGADGWALTWMDARVDGQPITQRRGKPVEVNALWVRSLDVARSLGLDLTDEAGDLADRARASFATRFLQPTGALFDVVDGPDGDDPTVRPNQLLASALGIVAAAPVLSAVESLVTSIGLRSLAPDDQRFIGQHRGDSSARDRAYHQGTVWPWLIGPYIDSVVRAGGDPTGLLDGLLAHLDEWGLGSISETLDGDAPHDATGCPFQAWSVAETLRAKRVTSQRAVTPVSDARP